jgi:dephospho-CoA kinase
MLTADGELDRRALRDLIFADPASAPGSRIHPAPVDPADMERAPRRAGPYVVLAIPLLVEGGAATASGRPDIGRRCGRIVQVQRLMARDGGEPEQAARFSQRKRAAPAA